MELFDMYQNLLTSKQQTYIESYYYDDLSITEISENLEVSRNAVHDLLKRSVAKLEDYESKLELVLKAKKQADAFDALRKIDNEDVQKILEELEKVE